MSQHAHARALTICQEEGAPLESAERIMRRLLDAGWHWKPPETFQPVPDTGPKADPSTREQHIAEAKAAIAEAKKKSSAATKPDENEDPQP